jgi:hypothetical protein
MRQGATDTSDISGVSAAPPANGRWFLAGLFLTTLSTLALEILDTRLLSVLTWYHLTFFVVSLAMLGMSAGAIQVFLSRQVASPARLARATALFAVAVPICHVVNLYVPLVVHQNVSAAEAVAFFAATLALGLPFFASGVAVTLALTRIPGRSGIVYGVDLLGASLGCLLVVPLLSWLDVSSAALFTSAIAAAGAVCFSRFAGLGVARPLALVAVLLTGALGNAILPSGIRIVKTKGEPVDRRDVVLEKWSTHSQVIVRKPKFGPAFYWAGGKGSERFFGPVMALVIDGSAGTFVTGWDRSPGALQWTSFDVTALPYHLRKGGDVAVIGLGGGRDALTALWAESRSVTGIEVSRVFLDILKGPFRAFAGLADDPRCTLVHDEARSWLARTDRRFDVLQMSLIDSWASTSSGAFTLTENGLYTREAWGLFLDRLKPGGLFSVSRWFAPSALSETNRTLSLGVAALLDRGVKDPSRHMALVSRGKVATLLLSNDELSAEDVKKIHEVAAQMEFRVITAPGSPSSETRLAAIAASQTFQDLERATEHPIYDFSPPTDERPFFFNVTRPRGAWLVRGEARSGVIGGNLVATFVLVSLAVVTAVLVAAAIALPLLLSLRRGPRPPRLGWGALYFGTIGMGFMLVQMAFLQRLSIYLGHPTYALVVILFTMILLAGLGSLASEKITAGWEARSAWLVPSEIALLLAAYVVTVAPLTRVTMHLDLLARAGIAIGLVGPVSFALGFCFPLGLRWMNRVSPDATPWLWGVNGATSVFGSVIGVMIAMWLGIHASTLVAAALYATLPLSGLVLQRAAESEKSRS